MRVGIDAGRVIRGRGGVSSYTRELIRALAGKGVPHEIVLFDLDGTTRRGELDHALGTLPTRVSVASTSRTELESIDLFHAPAFAMPPAGARRHVFTLHDLTVLSHPECHTVGNRVRTLTSIAEAMVRGATIIAVSEATRREALRLLSLPSENVEVLPPILSPAFSANSDVVADEEVVRSRGIGAAYVLAVASLEPRKNIGRVLEAWTLLPEELQQTHQLVVVTADEWRQTRVRRRLDAMSRARTVVSVGHLPAVELAALYRRARVFVFPSLAEGFGLPVVEAMACGAPVVTSNRSSLPEVAGEAAVLVDPEDPDEIATVVTEVLEDQSLRRRLRDRGFERARLYNSSAILPRLLAIYQRAGAV
jgi:glycosyltransferase involved in cell wall biosynthesis